MVWVKISIGWFLFGLLVFYHDAIFDMNIWAEMYYVWDKSKDVFLLMALWKCLRKLRSSILPLLIFSIIRLVWDLIAYCINENINNELIVNNLFGVCLVVYLVMIIKELLEWRKQNL